MGPTVTALKLKRTSRLLEVTFSNKNQFSISCELLRVCSPSAEVHGHGNPQLVTNKRMVNIDKIEPVGNYAVKLHFDDGHNTGLFSWDVLHDLGRNQASHFEEYLTRLKAAKASREPLIPLNVQFHDASKD
ncbi:gamma-butyrobetaine hydroxylase-like domain-containing protein [uncultured Ferrimonas sp.]|uniref:gamma-butyrobetaine hydroxylase-like domain-containing protein n=1 Tax=uncultured Ferrimonas sp. TaxID=432640 RepID=UPI0026186B72|nr:gamma-butyrobetaine hydroxylase-like domain-containing protein [uncultured Ferrimonas sp.]